MDGNIDGMNDADVREKNEGKKPREITRWDMAWHYSERYNDRWHEKVTFIGSRNETVEGLTLRQLLANGWEPYARSNGVDIFRRPAGVFRIRERKEVTVNEHQWNSDKMEYERVEKVNTIIEKEDIEDYPYPAEDMDMDR